MRASSFGKKRSLLPGRFPNHGGLTPAALVERAFTHRECRYFSVDRRRAPGAAGVIQPWRTIRSWVVNVITPRKPIAVASAVTEPRRADARRSWCTSHVWLNITDVFVANARIGESGDRETAGFR
jgi:hypothetical protein